jgi:hypothetical protein
MTCYEYDFKITVSFIEEFEVPLPSLDEKVALKETEIKEAIIALFTKHGIDIEIDTATNFIGAIHD